MKLIEGMKKVKELEQKLADLREKIGKHSADQDFETPMYPDQRKQVEEWLQAHHDIVKEVEKLKLAISRTNLMTMVPIQIGDNLVSKPLFAWILRRTKLAALEASAYSVLTDRNLREGTINQSNGTPKEVKIRRYYDPKVRDEKVTEYKYEPQLIDRTLEVTNAVTDLME